MKTKVKTFLALFPLILILVLAFRSGFQLESYFQSVYNFTDGYNFGTLQNCLFDLFYYFDIEYSLCTILAWYFSYLIFVGLGFLLYDLFLWFGSFVKSMH